MAETKKKDPQEKALRICEDARAQLVLHHPFVGRLGIQIPFVPVHDSRIHTIATNGKVIYINPEWVCSMPPVTMTAWIAHTVWTAALCHSFRRDGIEPGKFDLASDLEVYTLLNAEDVHQAYKPDFHEMFPKHIPVEEIVKKLTGHKFYRHKNTDIHLYSGGVVSLPEKLPGENKPDKPKPPEPKPQLQEQPGSGDSDGGTSDRKDPGRFSENDSVPGENFEADCECDPAVREIWRQRIIEAGQNYKMVYGCLPGELADLVNFFSNGKTNRIQLLRRYLSLCTGGEARWLPPARRFVWQGQYLPSHREPKLEIAVAVDTSGSIDEDDFKQFFTEIVNTVNGFSDYKLTLIQCDSTIQLVQEYSKHRPFNKNQPIELKGGGGTDFTPVFEYIKEKNMTPKVLLYYTDGCGDFPKNKPEYPVIWLLTKNADVPWGKKIKL